MKQTKRLLVAVLCLALLVGMVAAVAACHPDESAEKFSITLNYDSSKGSVNASAPAAGDKYVSGEQVTVTVTPVTNYEVSSFKVNGTDAQIPAGGGYLQI